MRAPLRRPSQSLTLAFAGHHGRTKTRTVDRRLRPPFAAIRGRVARPELFDDSSSHPFKPLLFLFFILAFPSLL
ncbi:hypothetical protein EUGRSUZ_C02100 [Eucalyptus grandis]|uniref:Uncharacterized protein n=2 Tax=Eucalyptus grandis TaxID=71139 RepID=A0ACC3LEK1_EUCGR|nr:hypothetical protein EUGRSUZ_C02100 [Eucalyptus grandis]